MRTTIYDIAKRANVSGVTVSRVLNNADVPIAPETRNRILSLAKELNYIPNHLAKALVTGKTNTLALIVLSMEEMLGVHYNQMLESVHTAAQEAGYLLITSENINSVAGGGQVDGIIWLADPNMMKEISQGVRSKLVYVWHSELLTDDLSNLIAWNDTLGTYKAVKYLLDLGHKKITAVWGDVKEENSAEHPKVKGYRKAMSDAGLEISEVFGTFDKEQYENGYILMNEFLSNGNRTDAVIARNDFLAIGCMRALKQHGFSIPGDVSVIGYNDTVVARCADPALTSVRTPMDLAGTIAVNQLLKMVNGEIESFTPIVLETSLTLRESCAPFGL